jgi:hypothetical protein
MDLEGMGWILEINACMIKFWIFEFVFPLGQQWHAKMDQKDVIGWE